MCKTKIKTKTFLHIVCMFVPEESNVLAMLHTKYVLVHDYMYMRETKNKQLKQNLLRMNLRKCPFLH